MPGVRGRDLDSWERDSIGNLGEVESVLYLDYGSAYANLIGVRIIGTVYWKIYFMVVNVNK